MNDRIEPGRPEDDPAPSSAEAPAPSAPSSDTEVAVLRRRARRRGLAAVAALTAAAVLGGLLLVGAGQGSDVELASGRPGAPMAAEVERLVASLDDAPIDPAAVELVSTVATYPDCDALVQDLRRVGAEHVGSRGFGDSGVGIEAWAADEDVAMANDSAEVAGSAAGGGDTLGTNVQVAGVDELDFVKAVGSLVYDLDGRGALRVTDAETFEVLSTLDLTPSSGAGSGRRGDEGSQVDDLLVADGRIAVLGSEHEVSEPVAGDPSATRASTSYMTVTFVDATDPAAPAVTDRVRVEGSLVSARLVGGEVRLVTTSHMADLGFVLPTTPSSVPTALDQNRRSVASSIVADWIPDWDRDGEGAEPLVPCERVHVPDTFAGVAMTSMVTFPIGTGRFAPAATSILAPATTLYAGLEKVAISSEVWVDPADRERLDIDDWQTAVHEFAFAEDAAPTYVASGIVDGSTMGQFAFGEIGDSLAVVTTEGTPWDQDPSAGVDLTILAPGDEGLLARTGGVDDLSDGAGTVSAVRFVEGRVLVSAGSSGRDVHVIDVTRPSEPRRAGRVTVPGPIGYFHPLPGDRALLIGSRSDQVGEGDEHRSRPWVQAHLLDVADPDAPRVAGAWERPWVTDEVGYDHHAFTYWPDRQLGMWGLSAARDPGPDGSNEAIVLSTEGTGAEVAVPTASRPPEMPAPCPAVEVTDPEARAMIGPRDVVLRCGDADLEEVDWARYRCYVVDDGMVARFVPAEDRDASFHVCSPASPPTVRRVLVVAGTPILLTDQTLEALDPQTFRSTSVTYHPTSGGW